MLPKHYTQGVMTGESKRLFAHENPCLCKMQKLDSYSLFFFLYRHGRSDHFTQSYLHQTTDQKREGEHHHLLRHFHLYGATVFCPARPGAKDTLCPILHGSGTTGPVPRQRPLTKRDSVPGPPWCHYRRSKISKFCMPNMRTAYHYEPIYRLSTIVIPLFFWRNECHFLIISKISTIF